MNFRLLCHVQPYLPVIRAKQLWSVGRPNRANFAFDYYLACWIIIALYLPGEFFG